MMGTTDDLGELNFMQTRWDLDAEQNIDEQIEERICQVFEDINLGWRSTDQQNQLKINIHTFKVALCFIQKHWSVLFRAEFPIIPNGVDGFPSSKLLTAVADTERKGNGKR